MPDEALLKLAREHPRGTERRTLLPFRDGLQSPAAYAAFTATQRDTIVRWAEARRRIRLDHGVDADGANLADPLIPEARLRALVIEGEIAAAAVAADATALIARAEREGVAGVVREIRRAPR
ncbi:MAG TPA: hypothetical protein VJQ09_06320 [Candidatus Limnocylindria bacterium]|nr:hypothetical protein [Candidatus Limnocylindria bacterium]